MRGLADSIIIVVLTIICSASVMSYRRWTHQPTANPLSRQSLDPSLCSYVDSGLKDLKLCSRHTQTVLTAYDDEIQILERLYYKGKNQHRSALFWKRITEIRRYGNRLKDMNVGNIISALHHSFFGEEAQKK